MATHPRPETLLPLTAVAFEILMTLADEDAHGYRIMQAVEERTGGTVVIHPGTLYRALARLMEQDLIDEGISDSDDVRRKSYSLTDFGREVAEAEAARLEQQVRHAKARRLLRRER
jgi:DNA-binding PadR family transcriptional regulator